MNAKHTPGPLIADLNTAEIPFRVYSKNTQGNVGFFYAVSDANLFAASPELLDFAERVSRLNRDAGEIGAGMLASIVDEANYVFSKATGAA